VHIEQNIHTDKDTTTLDGKAFQELGDNFLSVGDTVQAQQCYEKAAVLDTDNAGPYVGLGTVAMKNDLLDDAQLAFRVACRLDPKCSRAYEGLGAVAQKNGDHEHAFEMYLKCLELNTDNLAALLGLFQASSQMGSFAKIIHYLEVYLQMHPDDGSVMFSLATLYIKEDQFDKSKTMLLEILEADPENKDAADLLEEVQRNFVQTVAL